MDNKQQANTSVVNDDDKASIVCPSCGLTKIVSVGQFRDRNHTVKGKCTCGYSFVINLEFRRHRRKETDLEGRYNSEKAAVSWRIVRIVNLSLGGACFEIQGKHDIKIGHQGNIDFILDNHKRSAFLKNVIIRSIRGNIIGCKFIEDRAYEPALGFYLQP
ncbi:MAG: PilZ domain-containing protein [Deltaproteobacteria bacterium]|nr:PilZ domain-containing protein [Deltaproteobacteria bacterium]